MAPRRIPPRSAKELRALFAGALVASGALGCDRIPELWPRPSPNESATFASSVGGEGEGEKSRPPAEWVRGPDLCQEEIERREALSALPGAPRLEAHRVEILGRARAAPVVFRRAPEESDVDEPLLALRKKLLSSEDPAVVISEALRRTRGDEARRRAFFLREGYLFADQPLLALRLSQILRLDHLFREPVVLIERGGRELAATRKEGRYVLARPDGVEEEARLLLFDRVRAAEEDWGAPLHFEVGEVRRALGAARVRIERIDEDGAVASFEYRGRSGTLTTRGVLRFDERGRAHLACESIAPSEEKALLEAREEAFRARQLVGPVLAAIDEMVALALPFDEPKTEEGQQDGKLRGVFRQAYLGGDSSYEFNGDKYPVFDGLGRPRLPQVCIDFITDAFDWATGGGWAHRGKRRERVKGALHFASLELENPRSVENVADFASANPRWFDVVWLEPNERVPLYRREEFFRALERTWSRYQIGDVVFINGLRSDERYHYHSFFVVGDDPVSGAPTLLAANAGQPLYRTWEGEMANAPRRYIVARIRLRPELLERAYEQAQEHPGVPLRLTAESAPVD